MASGTPAQAKAGTGQKPTTAKDEITRRPEPGSLPARISFIGQTGGSAGYYIRLKDIPEGGATGGEPERKSVPILRYETQEEALQAAIEYRNRRAEELGLPIEACRGPHTEEAREQMSDCHNRLGLRGLGLSLDNGAGTVYPQLTAMWSEEDWQRQVKREMASRGIRGAVWAAVEELTGYLGEHVHTKRLRRSLSGAGRKKRPAASWPLPAIPGATDRSAGASSRSLSGGREKAGGTGP